MQLFKLLNQDMQDFRGGTWKLNTTYSKEPKQNPQLRTGDVLHFRPNRNLAMFLNEFDLGIPYPRIFKAKGEVVTGKKEGIEVGCSSAVLTQEVPIPLWVGSEGDRRIRLLFAYLVADKIFSCFCIPTWKKDKCRIALALIKRYLETGNKTGILKSIEDFLEGYDGFSVMSAINFAAEAALYEKDLAASSFPLVTTLAAFDVGTYLQDSDGKSPYINLGELADAAVEQYNKFSSH